MPSMCYHPHFRFEYSLERFSEMQFANYVPNGGINLWMLNQILKICIDLYLACLYCTIC